MFIAEYESVNDAYSDVFDNVNLAGSDFCPRGQECREIRPAHVTIRDARAGLYTGESRRLNYRFFAVETLGYIAGWGEEHGLELARLIVAANSRHFKFVRDDGKLVPMTRYGDALGPRLQDAVDALSADRHTRQIVLSIWNRMTQYESDIAPCTVSLSLFTEQWTGGQVLSMSSNMRSNDLNWGFPYDVAAFCAILTGFCGIVEMNVGSLYHFANSLHFYHASPPIVASAGEEKFLPPNRFIAPRYDTAIDWQESARKLLLELYEHVVLYDHAFRSFKSILEDAPNPNSAYWSQWCDMIRFSWVKYD